MSDVTSGVERTTTDPTPTTEGVESATADQPSAQAVTAADIQAEIDAAVAKLEAFESAKADEAEPQTTGNPDVESLLRRLRLEPTTDQVATVTAWLDGK
jgi:hypothetical protein